MYYNIAFSNDTIVSDLRRLINQIWKLIPMREHEEDWQKQLDHVLLELRGLNIMFGDQLSLLRLLSELEGLHEVNNFMVYRSAVFTCISLLTELTNSIDVN